jgi:hypothetical protein
MHGDLRMQCLREQPAFTAVQRQPGFVAGSFYAENDHRSIFSCAPMLPGGLR